jgi:hypothetical protein
MQRARIPDVGDLMFFADPSGIVAGAMQYDREGSRPPSRSA